MANVTVTLERIDSGLLTFTGLQHDVAYDGDYYTTFTVSQRGSQAIVSDPNVSGMAFFAFKLPDQYVGYHSGQNFHIHFDGLNSVTSGKIFPCFENPSNYLDAGCDHINKKISWGKLYGTYCFDWYLNFVAGDNSVSNYITNASNFWGNLLDPCGAKYFILLFHTYENLSQSLNPTFSIDINTDYPCSSIETVYPKDVSIKKNIAQLFSWNVDGSKFNIEYRNSIKKVRDDNQFVTCTFVGDNAPSDGTEEAIPCPTYLKSHVLKYRKRGTSVYTSISETNDHNYVEIAANTFDVDAYEYYIEQTLENGYTISTPLTDFNAIGQDAAPTITGVSNNSIPTVSWSDSNQAAFEVRIKDAEQNIVYTSGLLVGNAQSYQITKMLPNGTYIVEVRELNIYGIYSDWGSAQFTLNPSSVAAPTNIFVSVNNKYGVEISGTPAPSAQKTYVVRRIVGTDDIEIIGIYTGGIFTDYTAKGNTYYEYSLRNYNVAYADGAFTPVEVKVKEAVIQDGRDLTNFLDLSLSSNAIFNLVKTDEADRTLYNCLGRKYPIKEMGEWINSVRTFTAYVRHADLDRLSDINLNAPKVYYMGDHEYYACDLSIEDEGAYVGGGRMIGFTLTRIADDEGVVI